MCRGGSGATTCGEVVLPRKRAYHFSPHELHRRRLCGAMFSSARRLWRSALPAVRAARFRGELLSLSNEREGCALVVSGALSARMCVVALVLTNCLCCTVSFEMIALQKGKHTKGVTGIPTRISPNRVQPYCNFLNFYIQSYLGRMSS